MKKSEIKKLIKESIVEVLKENLSEGFDPLSQGPNPVKENPYPEWNSYMRKLEEKGEHGRYAQVAGAMDVKEISGMSSGSNSKHKKMNMNQIILFLKHVSREYINSIESGNSDESLPMFNELVDGINNVIDTVINKYTV